MGPLHWTLSPRDREDKCEVYTHQPHANTSLAESLAQSARSSECSALQVGWGPQQTLCLKREGGKPGESLGEPPATLRPCPGPRLLMPLHTSLRSQTPGTREFAGAPACGAAPKPALLYPEFTGCSLQKKPQGLQEEKGGSPSPTDGHDLSSSAKGF